MKPIDTSKTVPNLSNVMPTRAHQWHFIIFEWYFCKVLCLSSLISMEVSSVWLKTRRYICIFLTFFSMYGGLVNGVLCCRIIARPEIVKTTWTPIFDLFSSFLRTVLNILTWFNTEFLLITHGYILNLFYFKSYHKLT